MSRHLQEGRLADCKVVAGGMRGGGWCSPDAGQGGIAARISNLEHPLTPSVVSDKPHIETNKKLCIGGDSRGVPGWDRAYRGIGLRRMAAQT